MHTVAVDPEYGDWRLQCHWSVDDTARPCWLKDDAGIADPRYADECHYKTWADNTDGWLRGRPMEFEVEADYDVNLDCYTFTIIEGK